jgi:hypothetical protein
MNRTRLVRWLLALGLFLPCASHAIDIGVCTTTVSAGQIGRLVADLDCTGSWAVQLEANATLEMNGHAIAGGSWGVYCWRNCTITGPGEIRNATSYAVYGYRGRATITDLVFRDNELGIDLPLHRAALTNVVATDNRGTAIRVGRLAALNVVASDNGGPGILVSRAAKGSDVTVSRNADAGLVARSVRMVRLTVTDNVSTGLTSLGAVKLEDSVLTGNIFIGQPADLVSRGAPQLLGTTCDASVSLGPPPTYALGGSWGVCAND